METTQQKIYEQRTETSQTTYIRKRKIGFSFSFRSRPHRTICLHPFRSLKLPNIVGMPFRRRTALMVICLFLIRIQFCCCWMASAGPCFPPGLLKDDR